MIKKSSHKSTDISNRLMSAVREKRLHDAFILLRSQASELGDWKITEQIDALEQSYSMMLDYAISGSPDPERDELYSSITTNILKISEIVAHRLNIEDSPSLYYSTLRYERLQNADTLETLLTNYLKNEQQASLYNLLTSDSQQGIAKVKENNEIIARRIFNRVWTSFPLSGDDAATLSTVFEQSSPYPIHFQLLMVAALSLALVHFYDQKKVDILLSIYQQSVSAKLAIHALTGALITIYIHRGKYNATLLKQRFDSLRDLPLWKTDIRTIAMQLIRTRDTERIHKKLTDEIMPQMLKLRPDIAKRLSNKGPITDMSSIEENPEWEELLDKSGVKESLKELMQIQEEGGDVMMATFSNLKSFPFFNDVSNWFVPFRADASIVKSSNEKSVADLSSVLENMNIFCDGDKYSLLLMLLSVPEMQRKIMSEQINQQQLSAMEMQSATLTTNATERQQIANLFIQQLYRFFKLFRRRGEFNDPFATPISLASLDLFAVDLSDADTLKLVGEFYFKRGYYTDAFQIFNQLSDIKELDNASLQKMGVCLQKTGNAEGALSIYLKAELLLPDSVWTMRRIASCYRTLGNISKALEYYKRIEIQRPDDLDLALNIGHCLLELEKYAEAQKYYFKVEYLAPQSHKALRPIAWCSFVMGEFDRSLRYYNMVLEDKPSATDYMNMGHLHMALNQIKEAINFYALSIANSANDIDRFLDDLRTDYTWLEKAGVEVDLMPLVVDALLYKKH
ncbi:MAG: tetratricopeptide repeat protein [Muribaculum sp.]|nr:tetratricopeptide repeat protein [Muribaculaceae bacterium]MCM1081024.1 tetratricopeptide repeat protein [Muribaculum sp.]